MIVEWVDLPHTVDIMSSTIGKIIIGVIVVCLLLAGAAMLFVTPAPPKESLTGTILVSSTVDAASPFLETYAVRMDGTGVSQVGEDTASVGNFYSFTRDGSKTVFVGTNALQVQQEVKHEIAAGDIMQVYEAPAQAGHIAVVGEAQQISTDHGDHKQMPAISDDGALVAYVTSTSSSRFVASSTIHVIRVASSTELVSMRGSAPQWLNTVAFYYVAPDGVRLYNTSNRSSTLVIPVTGQSNFKLAVSPDRLMFAFSNPDSRSVYFYQVLNNGLILQPLKTLDTLGFWTVFSPDSRYVAIQTASSSPNGTLSNPSLAIYATTSFEQVDSVSLGELLNDRLFVTAWIR